MSRREWERVKRVAGEALTQPPADRERFAAEACGGDETLRREVLSLLESVAEAGDRLERSALETAGGRRAAQRNVALRRLFKAIRW